MLTVSSCPIRIVKTQFFCIYRSKNPRPCQKSSPLWSYMCHPEKSTRSISDLLKIPHGSFPQTMKLTAASQHRSFLLVVKDLYNLLNATGGVWSQLLPSCYSSHHYGDLQIPSFYRGQWDSIGILMGYEWDINEIH